MKSRLLLLSLWVLLAVAALGLWHFLAPEPGRAPARLAAVLPDAASTQLTPTMTSRPPVEPAPDWTLGEAGKVSPVNNDPRHYEVWLRVIDDETGRPLVRTSCEMWGVYASLAGRDSVCDFEGRVLSDDLDPTSRQVVPLRLQTTDDHGLLKLSATPAGIDPARLVDPATEDLRREGTRKQLSGFDVDFPDNEVGFLMPVPRHAEPVTRPHELGLLIARLRREPSLEPLDVRVRRAPVITGRVTDTAGKPLADVTVFAFPLSVAPHLESWAGFQNGMLGALQLAATQRGMTEGQFLAELPLNVGGASRAFLDAQWPAHHLYHAPHSGDGGRDGTCDTLSGADGTYTLPTLCRGRWLVGAYRNDSSYTEARLELAGDASRDFSLQLENFGGLEVVVHFEQPEDSNWIAVDLRIRRAGPTGAWLPLDQDNLWKFDKALLAGPPAVFRIARVPAGKLAVHAELSTSSHEDPEAARVVNVVAGQTTRVEFHLSEKQYGWLQPEVYFDGRRVDGASYMTLDEQTGEILRCTAYEQESHSDLLTLGAGSYQLYFPGLAPIPCAIEQQQITKLRVDLPVAVVEFSIDPELYDLLADEQSVGLNMDAIEEWRDARHLEQMDEWLAEDDERYDILELGRTRTWKLPPGEYLWELWSHGGPSLVGPLNISAGHNSVRFSLGNLPGLGVVRVDLTGFSDEDDPTVTAEDAVSPDGPWCHGDYPSFSGPRIILPRDGPGPQWFHDVVTLRRDRHTQWLITGRGRQLSVSCGWAEGEFGTQVTRGVTVPGSLHFKREDPTTWGELDIHEPEGSDYGYAVSALSADYIHQELSSGLNRLQQGNWRVLIRRSHWPDSADRDTFDHAVVDIHVGASAASIDLAQLNYQPSGKLVLQLKGRGTTSAGLDPWWEIGDHTSFREPILEHLDGRMAGQAPFTGLGRPDTANVEPASALLVYNPLLLAPGRYRLLPWFGAPGALAREFEIKPGQTTTIVLKGG
ncbi:MAG: hypothetical protein KF754_14690 [Planctomycetes bacterium]|nr:hypothetical protein [Planctomycetota bacterium]